MQFTLKDISFDKQSKFQRAQIVTTGPFGKTLVLDGKTQSALFDEKTYHESLVHPAMLAHGAPKRVYIGGGGEMATAREVLRHACVEECIMVDIDETVVEICKEQMPEWHGGCLDDARLQVHYDDAKAWLERSEGKFDVIIMDIADPIEAGPGIALYTKEFYDYAITKLNPGGVLVTQSGPGSVLNSTECFAAIHKTLATSFKHVLPYTVDIPSFGSNWAFNMAFNDDAKLAQRAAAAGMADAVAEFNLTQPAAELTAAFDAINGEMQFMDSTTYRGVMGVPLTVRKALAAEDRIITKENPVFMY